MCKQDKILGFLAVFLALSALAQAAGAAPKDARAAYSSSNMGCLVGNDFYAVHFTALQPGRQKGERSDFTKYCQEIPAVGATFLSIDLLDRDVRKTPITLRVVEEEFSEEGGRPPKTIRTVAEAPAKLYNTGTADIQANIAQPGHYALIATIGEDAISEDDHLRIPFTVAIEGATKVDWLGRITGFIVLAFFGTMAAIGYRTYRAYRPKTREPVEAGIEAKVGARVEAG